MIQQSNTAAGDGTVVSKFPVVMNTPPPIMLATTRPVAVTVPMVRSGTAETDSAVDIASHSFTFSTAVRQSVPS